MNKYKKYLFTLCFALAFCLLSPVFTQAQPSDPGCDPLDPACPIDGGVSLLIAAGIGIGAKKIYDLKNKEKKEI